MFSKVDRGSLSVIARLKPRYLVTSSIPFNGRRVLSLRKGQILSLRICPVQWPVYSPKYSTNWLENDLLAGLMQVLMLELQMHIMEKQTFVKCVTKASQLTSVNLSFFIYRDNNGLPCWLSSKESACKEGDAGPIPGSKATHSSILTWEIPWAEEPGGLKVHGVAKSQHDFATEQQQQNLLNFL